ncbi:MAG: ribosome biogenesis GTP-binding protein YihA/YsxC, partial [Clostridiales bacterium]|nr:ribosome biogenesis GTP-binding protein YihA/YsxC [Clostridiales bacterium]
MIVKNPKFVISAVSPKQYPETDMLEIAFAGRSNVGKSSLINALLGRKNIARKSATPGKTRQINYYNLDDEILFVDLPGYGYAKVSKGEKNLWANVIENYLNIRPQLYLIILIVDIRHEPTQDDVKMAQWLKKSGVNFIVAASKKDKLKKTQIKPGLDIIGKTLGLEP